MDMAKIVFRDQEWEVKSGMTVRAALEKIGLDPLFGSGVAPAQAGQRPDDPRTG